MTKKTQPGEIHFVHSKVDVSGLMDLSGGSRVMILKYIRLFLSTAPVQLTGIKAAVESNNADLLYNNLHMLKPQLELMGINGILEVVKLMEAALLRNRVVTETVKTNVDLIAAEITLACAELELIQKNYL